MTGIVTIRSNVQRVYHMLSFGWDHELVGSARDDH